MLVVSVAQEKALVLSLQVSQQAHYREGCLSLNRDTAFGILVDLSGNKFIVGATHSFAFLKAGIIVYKGQTVGQFTKTALTCGQTAN